MNNGAEVYATDGQGNVLTDSSGQPIYFRIFYPGGGIGPDGGTTDNQNVYLVRQAPVTILGTSTPGSTGLFDSSGNPVTDIEYDAGDPRVYDNGYQYVDNSGGYQRSLISEIKVTFTGIVDNVDASQLSLSLSQNSNETVGLQVTATQVVGEDTMVTLTFLPNPSDPGLTRQRQLADGELTDFVLSDLRNWTFTVNAGAVTQYAAHQVGGSLSAVTMQNAKADQFWTLFGDYLGTRHVDATDGAIFSSALSSGPSNAYFTASDYWGNGQALDPSTFTNYGVALAPPDATPYGSATLGMSQRSLISEITITFSGIVDNVDASQISLSLSQNVNETVGLQVVSQKIVGEETVVTLTFLPNASDPGLTRQRQLADGELTDFVLADLRNWTLEVRGAAVTQYAAHNASAAVSMASTKLDQFWTLFGDYLGTRHVDATDGAIFSSALSSGPSNAFFTASDYWGNGQALDPSTFTNYGVALAPPDVPSWPPVD